MADNFYVCNILAIGFQIQRGNIIADYGLELLILEPIAGFHVT